MTDQITQKTLRDAEWKRAYSYTSDTLSFTTYACDALPGLSVTHERKPPRIKTRTIYTVNGRKTDSPTQAVRLYNAKAREQTNSGRPPAGSPQSLGRSRRDVGL